MPRIAVRALVIENEMILLSKYCKGNDTWYVLPGGGVKEGESLEEAFARETKEECGNTLPFQGIIFIRDVIANRQVNTTLPQGFHQVEFNVKSSLDINSPVSMINPDENQVGIVWVPLKKLWNIKFFPSSLLANFFNKKWEKLYYGECA